MTLARTALAVFAATSLTAAVSPAASAAAEDAAPRANSARYAYGTQLKVGGVKYQACYDAVGKLIKERVTPKRAKTKGHFEGSIEQGSQQAGTDFGWHPGFRLKPFSSGTWYYPESTTITVLLAVKGHKTKTKTYLASALPAC